MSTSTMVVTQVVTSVLSMPEVSTTERVTQGAVIYGALAGASIASMAATR